MGRYRNMREVNVESYRHFLDSHDSVVIGKERVKLEKGWKIDKYEPDDFVPERTTVWSFPDRGRWATHKGNYRGNWSPYVPRNLILRYTEKGDTVLDQMMGGGTTLVEAKLLDRDAIGVDINSDAAMVAMNRLDFPYESDSKIRVYVGDARNLNAIPNESVDLIATHPPYANIIKYTKKKTTGDISTLPYEKYLRAMKRIADESYRVLKGGKHCAILIGDTRKHKHYVPISHNILRIFLRAGFILRENIIKLQWNTKTTREKWNGKNYDFYLIGHEHIFVFRKPESLSEYKKFRYSHTIF